jgi:flagellar biosynthesis chaperone FliJ
MRRRPDAALEVALEQRQRVMDDAQAALSLRERAVHEQAQAVMAARARVRLVMQQMDAAQRPAAGVALPVALLGDLETLLDWCEVQVAVQEHRLSDVQAEADAARTDLATAHQNVRALELVLEARRAERAEKVRREELRMADETAARVHSQKTLAAR